MNDLHHEVVRQVARERVARMAQEAQSARVARELRSRRPARRGGLGLADAWACLRARRRAAEVGA
jgi:hypothetical protein